MSQLAAHAHAHDDHGHHAADLSDSNILLPPGGLNRIGTPLLALGLIGLVATVAGGFIVGLRHALAAYHVGAMTCLAMGLGAMFFVMAFHLFQAGWAVTLRRQFENLMILAPVAAIMVIPVLVIDILAKGQLFAWLGEDARKTDSLLKVKAAYLSPMFFTVRVVFYTVVWAYLARRLRGLSLEQDRSGDKWLSNRARFTSSWGMLVFALTTAFAAFDWLKSVDYRFFSTMWGVYFFAGSAYVGTATMILILAMLRRAGKMEGAVTSEHFHDLGKLLFSFTVFWAYIAFSQYFLIWYSGIPEETAFFHMRLQGAWPAVGAAVIVSHFALPFVIMLFRGIKRNHTTIAFFAIWSIAAHVVDMFWVIRPIAHVGDAADPVGWSLIWIDAGAVLGVLGVLGWLIVNRVTSGPLVAVNDPRLGESLEHRNYV